MPLGSKGHPALGKRRMPELSFDKLKANRGRPEGGAEMRAAPGKTMTSHLLGNQCRPDGREREGLFAYAAGAAEASGFAAQEGQTSAEAARQSAIADRLEQMPEAEATGRRHLPVSRCRGEPAIRGSAVRPEGLSATPAQRQRGLDREPERCATCPLSARTHTQACQSRANPVDPAARWRGPHRRSGDREALGDWR